MSKDDLLCIGGDDRIDSDDRFFGVFSLLSWVDNTLFDDMDRE